jgi:hypothetical protein
MQESSKSLRYWHIEIGHIFTDLETIKKVIEVELATKRQ